MLIKPDEENSIETKETVKRKAWNSSVLTIVFVAALFVVFAGLAFYLAA